MTKVLPTYVITNGGDNVTTWTRVRELCADQEDELSTLLSIELGPRPVGRLTAENSPIQDAAYRETWAVMPYPAPPVHQIRAMIQAKRYALDLWAERDAYRQLGLEGRV